MYRLLNPLAILLLVNSLLAVPPYILNPCNSAVSSSGEVLFQVDYTTGCEPGEIHEVKLFTKASSTTSHNMVQVADDEYYHYTYETSLNITEPTDYYYWIKSDTLWATQSFRNPNDNFPPENFIWAYAMSDPIEDLENDITDQKLDITGVWAGYSNNKFYFKMSHRSGDWDGSGGIFGPYYGFVLYITNPAAPSDTFYYALVRTVNISGIFGPGLWRFTESGDYTKIGDIEHDIFNDTLYMACNRSDLINDTYFGEFIGYINIGGRTDKKAVLTAENLRADITDDCKFYPSHNTVDPAYPNNAPLLSSNEVIDNGGYNYTFLVNYTDTDNNCPTDRRLIINSTEFLLTSEHLMSSTDHSYDSGSLFEAVIDLGEPLMSYAFDFSDGESDANITVDVPEKILPESIVSANVFPNPFNAETKLEITLPERTDIDLKIYNINGQMVNSLAIYNLKQGMNVIPLKFDLPSGVYYYNITPYNLSGKMVFLK